MQTPMHPLPVLLLLLLLFRSSAVVAPALTAAYQLLLQHPRIAAAPAALSRSSMGGCRQQHCTCVQQHPGQLVQVVQAQAQHFTPCSMRQQLQLSCRPQSGQRHIYSLCVPCLSDRAASSTNAADVQDSTVDQQSAPGPDVSPPAAPSTDAVTATAAASKEGDDSAADAAAALLKLQQVLQRLPPQQAAALDAEPASSSRSESSQQLMKPVRPMFDPSIAQQNQRQQQPRTKERLLTWRSIHPAGTAAFQQQQSLQQQQQSAAAIAKQQQPQEQRQQQLQQQIQMVQQMQPLPPFPAPVLEPSIVDGRPYLTSPVSVVASTTVTRRLAGSISAAFLVHEHQLMFAVGPQALGISIKALATARRMLADSNSQPVNILMQPTLRGGRTQWQQSYALDIMRVGDLPMQPGVTGRQLIEGQAVGAGARLVHITSTSNERAAARSLVENMPARGQTIMRVMGPYATETAVLAVALARPLMQARWGQDLAVLVMWNAYKAPRSKQTGLLLSVFRCELGSYPPKVLLQPPSQRVAKRIQHGERFRQQQQHKQQRRQDN